MKRTTSPFHAGEQRIQRLAGVRDRIELRGRAVIRDYMPEQHRAFFAALPFLVVGLADQNGHPWATTLSGAPGFMNSAGWGSNFQRVVETGSTVGSKIASSVKVSR